MSGRELPGKARTPFSKSEGAVLRELWEQGGGTVREMTDNLQSTRGWSSASVGNFMERMRQKGWVEVTGTLRYGERRYEPTVSRAEALSWLARVFYDDWVDDELSLKIAQEELAKHAGSVIVDGI